MVIINFLERGKSGDNKNRIFRFNKLNENEREVFEKELKKRIAGSQTRKTGDITYETNHSGTGMQSTTGSDHTS